MTLLLCSLTACGTRDSAIQVAVLGTRASGEFGQDDAIVETEATLLPGGRANRKGERRLPVPSASYVPSSVSHEVKNARLVLHFIGAWMWSVPDGYLHTLVGSSTLPSLMSQEFSVTWKLKEVNSE